jgi:hypothetical protein
VSDRQVKPGGNVTIEAEGLQLAGQLLANNSGAETTTAISADVTLARTETPPVEAGGA